MIQLYEPQPVKLFEVEENDLLVVFVVFELFLIVRDALPRISCGDVFRHFLEDFACLTLLFWQLLLLYHEEEEVMKPLFLCPVF
jgi:hypothetical protein